MNGLSLLQSVKKKKKSSKWSYSNVKMLFHSWFWSHNKLSNGSPVRTISLLRLLSLMPQEHQQHRQSPQSFAPDLRVRTDSCVDWDRDLKKKKNWKKTCLSTASAASKHSWRTASGPSPLSPRGGLGSDKSDWSASFLSPSQWQTFPVGSSPDTQKTLREPCQVNKRRLWCQISD